MPRYVTQLPRYVTANLRSCCVELRTEQCRARAETEKFGHYELIGTWPPLGHLALMPKGIPRERHRLVPIYGLGLSSEMEGHPRLQPLASASLVAVPGAGRTGIASANPPVGLPLYPWLDVVGVDTHYVTTVKLYCLNLYSAMYIYIALVLYNICMSTLFCGLSQFLRIHMISQGILHASFTFANLRTSR